MVLEHHEGRPFQPGMGMIYLVLKQEHRGRDVYVGLSISGVSRRGNGLQFSKTMNRDLGKVYSVFFHVL